MKFFMLIASQMQFKKEAQLNLKYIYNIFRKKNFIKTLAQCMKIIVKETKENDKKLLGKNMVVFGFKTLMINSEERIYKRLNARAFFRLMRRKLVNLLINFLIFKK